MINSSMSAHLCAGGDNSFNVYHIMDTSRLVNRLKNSNPEKYRIMCTMHLSFLLDLSGTALADILSAHEPKFVSENHGVFGVHLSDDIIDTVLIPIMDYLTHPECICQEGLFRKSGLLHRQRQLREQMNRQDVIWDLQAGIYSPHDCANILKTFLAELPEPLLLENHYPAFYQVLDLIENDPSNTINLKSAKLLQSIQLLLQLLPLAHHRLLKALLILLNKTSNDCEENRMTSESLGILFTPCLFYPRKMSGFDIQTAPENITKIVTYMIDNVHDIFCFPDLLVQDIASYWEDMESPERLDDQQNSAKKKRRVSTDAVKTVVTYCDREFSQQAASLIDTEFALAELYAHVSMMPESINKQKLLKRFNKANGPGTPTNNQKYSKSIGNSLKKIVTFPKKVPSDSDLFCTPHKDNHYRFKQRIGRKSSTHSEPDSDLMNDKENISHLPHSMLLEEMDYSSGDLHCSPITHETPVRLGDFHTSASPSLLGFFESPSFHSAMC